MKKCIVMFSGGLDSTIAVHLMQQQNLEVVALHFVLPFQSHLDFEHAGIKGYADALGVPLRIEEEGEEFLAMVSNPDFGYGKHANPCIDCRIHRLQKAFTIMQEIGASFIVTGEVMGQRPMSQRKECLGMIEEKCGFAGLLVRPLCAQLLEPTIPEQKGWIDRSTLLGISGRSRKEQLAYAKQHNLKHAAPAGGCVLTEEEVSKRFDELRTRQGDLSLSDFKLCAYGRHFRIDPECRAIIGRFQGENDVLEKLAEKNDVLMEMAEITGPSGLIRGSCSEEALQKSASLLARYSRARTEATALVKIVKDGTSREVSVAPASEELCETVRI